MGIFRRRRQSASEVTEAPVAETAAPAVETAAPLDEEVAEEREEYDEEAETGRASRGLNPHWNRHRDDDVSKHEMRAVADRESDTEEQLFIRSEREAEERGRRGFNDR
ncbi:MAG: hypothetical protein ACHQFZ_01190 [Acidimicrobiales bacterium]